MVDIPDDIVKAAQDSEERWGIPASVSLAQFGLESAWGKRVPEGSNNPFGMKTRAGKDDPYVIKRTREVSGGRDYYIDGRFRKFDSMTAAFDAHGELLATAPVYAKARRVLPDPEAFAHALTGVYATDPNYGTLLVAIMRQSGLYKYNAVAHAIAPPPAPVQVAEPVPVTIPLAQQAINALGDVPTQTVTSTVATPEVLATTIVTPNTTATRVKRALSGWQGNALGAAGIIGGLLLDPTFASALGRFTTSMAAGGGRWGAIVSLIGAGLVAYRARGAV